MGQKVLLADDSITVQKIVKLSLTEEGIDVIAVGNGEQAVQQLESMQPDLVMADVFMPGKDGYEVCEFVKSHPRLRHIPVILLVHAFEPFDPDRAKKVGADHQLTKPFQSIRALVTTVQDLLRSPLATESAPPVSVSETTKTMPAQSSVIVPVLSPLASARADEEFAVVSSLPPTSEMNFVTEAAAEESMPSFMAAPVSPSFASASPNMSEVNLPMPMTSTGGVSNVDLMPPAELPVLPSEWQVQLPPEPTRWESTFATPTGEMESIAAAFSPTSVAVNPVLGDSFSDDVLELSDVVLPASVATAVEMASPTANQFTSDVPLLAVLGNLPASVDEPQPTTFQQETPSFSFTGSFDVGTGAMEPHPQTHLAASHNPVQDFKVGTLSQTEGTDSAYLPEEVLEEIVNRVVQRLSTKAIQEIAWEVVPEMAELLLRKHISQQKHATH